MSLKLHKRIYIGYSGGMDSSLLLHLFVKASNILSFKIKAIHINHNYSSSAENWSYFCKKECDKLNIPISIYCIKKGSKNIEEYFRIKRLRYISNVVLKNSTLALAHHKNDFLETLVLNTFRGTGSTGLTSIKKLSKIKNLNIIRPLITIKKIHIEAYINKYKINYITDFSNFGMFSNRNYLRYIVSPTVTNVWNNFEEKLYNCISIYDKTYNTIYNKYIYFLKSKGYSNNIIFIYYLIFLPLYWRYEILKLWINSNNCKTPNTAHLVEINKLILSKKTHASHVNLYQYKIKKYKNYLYIKKNTQHKYKNFLYFNGNSNILEYKNNVQYKNDRHNYILKLYRENTSKVYYKKSIILLPGYWATKTIYKIYKTICLYRCLY